MTHWQCVADSRLLHVWFVFKLLARIFLTFFFSAISSCSVSSFNHLLLCVSLWSSPPSSKSFPVHFLKTFHIGLHTFFFFFLQQNLVQRVNDNSYSLNFFLFTSLTKNTYISIIPIKSHTTPPAPMSVLDIWVW